MRKSEGESWTPHKIPDFEFQDKGLICSKNCHKRVAYKDLDITFEMRGTDIFRIWWCLCGNMLEENNMSDLALRYEIEKETGELL